MSARYSSTKLPKSKLTVYVPPCLRCAALEAELYRLAEWETAKQLRDDALNYRLAELNLWQALGYKWLAAEEERIFGKAGA
jgi:hypothetical protein